MPRSFIWLSILIVAAIPYVPALRHEFVYDDHGAIEENEFLASTSNLWRVATLQTLRDARVLDGQRPMLLLTHFAERSVWGLNPIGYHLANLALHLLVVALVLALAQRLGLQNAWIAGLLYGLHPVLSEVVLVPSFREDLLAAIFGLLYLRFASRPVPSLAFLSLGLLSKESAVVYPALAAWMWICFPAQRPGRRTMAISLGAGLLLVLSFLAVAYSGRGLQASTGAWNGYSLQFPENIYSAPYIFLEHLRLLIVPWPLCADRVLDPVASAFAFRFVAGLLAVFAVTGLALLSRQTRPPIAFGLGWLLIAFVPVSNLVPLFNPVADRYLYFMAVGFALVLSSVLRPLTSAIFCAVFAVLIHERVPDWKNDYELWMKTGQQEPRSARAHTWIGLEMKNRDHLDVAERHFIDADRINPQDVTALVNLAILDAERGDLAAAEARLREAIRRRPDKAEARANLATVLRLQGKDAGP